MSRLPVQYRELGPQVTGSQSTIDGLTHALIGEAARAHAQYPQYAGHWEGWVVVEITRKVHTKSGLAFAAGDLVR